MTNRQNEKGTENVVWQQLLSSFLFLAVPAIISVWHFSMSYVYPKKMYFS